MADLTTPEGVAAELIATAGYEFEGGVELAKRRVKALRCKLDLPQAFNRNSQGASFYLKATQDQLDQALAYIAANEVLTDEQRLANPSVIHTDFSTFRGHGNSLPSETSP